VDRYDTTTGDVLSKIGGDIEKDFSALSECVKKYGAVK